MKFLLFNIAVVAALGYIFYERGGMEGTKIETLAENRKAVVSEKFETPADTVTPDEQPPAAMGAATSSEQEQAFEVTNAGTQIAGEDENLVAEEAKLELGDPLTLDQLAEVEVPSVMAPEPVDMAVKARRDFVLGNQTTLSEKESTASNRMAERSEQLRDLAEEMEFLSIDMIYQ